MGLPGTYCPLIAPALPFGYEQKAKDKLVRRTIAKGLERIHGHRMDTFTPCWNYCGKSACLHPGSSLKSAAERMTDSSAALVTNPTLLK